MLLKLKEVYPLNAVIHHTHYTDTCRMYNNTIINSTCTHLYGIDNGKHSNWKEENGGYNSHTSVVWGYWNGEVALTMRGMPNL